MANRKTRRAVKTISKKKVPAMADINALKAALEESRAENEYLRNRNLSLRIAVENLSEEIGKLTPKESEEITEDAKE